MKVVHIVWDVVNGGIQNMLTDIINYQVGKSEIHLVVIDEKPLQSIMQRIDDRCHIHVVGRKANSHNPFFILKLNRLLRKLNPDVIHYHGDIYKFVFHRPKAKVFTAHNLSWGKRHVKGMDRCVAISSIVYDNLIQNGYQNAVRIDNGINFDLIKQRKSVYDGTLRIVQTGRLVSEYKGQDLLIEAVNRLVKSGITNLHATIIGNGPSREALEKQITDNNLEKYVTLAGEQSRDYIYEHLSDYDVFVQPSRWEGFGLTVAEAVAAKLPIIISRHEGPMQIIDHGKYGHVFEIEDIDGMVEEIKNLMAHFPSDQQLQEAYDFARSNFSIDKTAQSYLDLYDSLLK